MQRSFDNMHDRYCSEQINANAMQKETGRDACCSSQDGKRPVSEIKGPAKLINQLFSKLTLAAIAPSTSSKSTVLMLIGESVTTDKRKYMRAVC